jgi:hypothetical protein
MKCVEIAVSAVVVACLVSATADAASTRHKVTAQAAPQSREALYQSCRQQAFRNFGWHNGARTVLYTDFLVQQTDYCVSNGGRL